MHKRLKAAEPSGDPPRDKDKKETAAEKEERALEMELKRLRVTREKMAVGREMEALFPVEHFRPVWDTAAAVLQNAGLRLEQKHGSDAQQILLAALDQVELEIERLFAE